MKIRFKKIPYDPTPRLTIGKFHFDFLFQWGKFFSKKAWNNNWQTFEFVDIEIEHEGCLYNWNGTIILFGVGILWCYQYKPFEDSRYGKDISESVKEIEAGTAKLIPMEEVMNSIKSKEKENNERIS